MCYDVDLKYLNDLFIITQSTHIARPVYVTTKLDLYTPTPDPYVPDIKCFVHQIPVHQIPVYRTKMPRTPDPHIPDKIRCTGIRCLPRIQNSLRGYGVRGFGARGSGGVLTLSGIRDNVFQGNQLYDGIEKISSHFFTQRHVSVTVQVEDL